MFLPHKNHAPFEKSVEGLDLSMWTKTADKNPEDFEHVRVIVHNKIPFISYYRSHIGFWLKLIPNYGAGIVGTQDEPTYWLYEPEYDLWMKNIKAGVKI